jgi:hypothetical protein
VSASKRKTEVVDDDDELTPLSDEEEKLAKPMKRKVCPPSQVLLR